MTNPRARMALSVQRDLRISDFGFLSEFGFRASDFSLLRYEDYLNVRSRPGCGAGLRGSRHRRIRLDCSHRSAPARGMDWVLADARRRLRPARDSPRKPGC